MTSEMQSQWNSSWLDSGNQTYLDNQFETFLKNPSVLSDEWRRYFQELLSHNQQYMDVSHADVREFFKNYSYVINKTTSGTNVSQPEAIESEQKAIDAYRLLGHLQSNTNPIALGATRQIPGLDPQREDLQKIYCGTAALESMHIDNSVEREWVQKKFEAARSDPIFTHTQKSQILELIIAADGLEKYLGAKYPGAKRFSLEGCDSLIVGLDEIISSGTARGVEEIVIAMTHRGRLNVLVNLLGKIPRELFDQFENRHNSVLESGDVKYHQGFASDLQTANGNVHVSLIFNPSHLEIVTPVAMGSVRARQERRGDKGRSQVLCVAIHGDAAFSGQGVVMESLNMSETRGYGIGGTIHIIVNNQIGFTTSNLHDARSTLYCTDVGKMLSAPIFHVNADDPEAVACVFNIALEYRVLFQQDVIIDLIGYRRMGHNEADEPSATQPLMYKTIRNHPTVNAIYSEKLIADKEFTKEEINALNDQYRLTLDQLDCAVVKRLANKEWKNAFATDWKPYSVRDWRFPTNTKVALETLKNLATARDTVPENFTLDSRVHKIVEARIKMTAGETGIDWGYAETLAYASLLNEGYGVRLSGQDSGRGTFFHRHAVWHDQNTAETYISLCNLQPEQGHFWVIDSLLSEAAVLAFDYGFSTSEPRTLTLWEAQFGDFANNAQVVIDQFISSGELKWGRLSGLVMLLPHGYEGQGPEHSSARIERYLQLCAQQNMQVCIPSNPSQIFHLLRRQMLRPMRKPLIVITPKSLLRHRFAISTLADLADGEFQVVIPDEAKDYNNISRVILCSGKVYYELLEARLKSKQRIALIRLEQLYPFPDQELTKELHKYVNTKDIIWCQEEPHNQGAWFGIQHYLLQALLPIQQLIYAGRQDSASPAVGYYHLHEQQQQELIKAAIGEE
jgi:2-oxoglutarate dehydrogenase E1 component